MKTSKRIAAVTLALLAAAQLAGCNSDDKPAPAPTGDTGGTGSGGNGGGDTGGNTGGGDTGGGDTGGGDTGGGDTGGGDTGGGDTGGGDTGGGDTGGTPGAMASGVFVDAPVAGLSYTTSSDLSGVTDAEGRYDYREGDTVTFSLGALELGTVTAQGVVTPKTVAEAASANGSADAATVAVNLLVLLQSLDADGNPDDGITLTKAITDAVAANAIDLKAPESSFTAALGTFVTQVSSDAGVTLTPVTREDAVEHFTSHAPAALAGSYVLANANFAPVTQKPVSLTIFRNGRYLLGGQYDRSDCNLESGRTAKNELAFSDANGNGVEHGSYSWDPLTNQFSVGTMLVETDGYCGLNEPDTQSTNDVTVLEPAAKGLVFKDAAGNVVYRFARLQRETTTLAGAWVQPTALLHAQPFVFTFFPSSEDGLAGRYLMVDASLPSTEFDTSPGIEAGCYSIDAQDNAAIELNASVCTDAIDTNETAGASNTDTLKVFIDANDRMVIADGEDHTGFTRLPARLVTHESLAGSWIIDDGSGAPLAEQTNLAMLSVFEDGSFLFGSQEDDASCVPAGYPSDQLDEGGNGVEYGTLSLTDIPGLVVPQNVSVDTNGECGLYHNGKTHDVTGAAFKQAYLVAPNEAGDALVVWANDEEDAAGIVFKRVPSVANEIWGAWKWSRTGAADGQFAVTAYLQGGPHDGVMFEVSSLPDEFDDHVGVGILREAFEWNSPTMVSYRESYELCVDTEDTTSSCLDPEGDALEEEYFITGDIVVDDEDDYGSMRRIP